MQNGRKKKEDEDANFGAASPSRLNCFGFLEARSSKQREIFQLTPLLLLLRLFLFLFLLFLSVLFILLCVRRPRLVMRYLNKEPKLGYA